MTPIENLLSRLSGVMKSGNRWSARCPAHEDRNASLSISQTGDGAALLKCHAGCDTSEILVAIGLGLRDLFPPKSCPAPTTNGKLKSNGQVFPTAEAALAALEHRHGKPSALWQYHNAEGKLVGFVVRWNLDDGKKLIRPVSLHADGWHIGAMAEPRPLYRLPELAQAEVVVVCEGEKTADAARALGFVATTSAGGSQAPGKTDLTPLAGKNVLILPDNDASGRKYAETVAGSLGRLTPPPEVRILDLAPHAPRLPEGGDLADVLADPEWCGLAMGDAAQSADLAALIERLAHGVEPWRPADADDLAFRPFPVDALPAAIRGFVDAGGKAIDCDSSYIALPLLTAIGAAIGNTRRLELKRGWLVPPILWCVIVGESGTTKTPAFKLVMRPVRERQEKAWQRHAETMKQYENDLARYDKEMAAWKKCKDKFQEPPTRSDPPACERYIVSDTTVEALAPILLANPRGVLLARDELAGWLGSFDRYAGKGKASADAANWLSMFNAESIIVDRKTGTPRTIHVPQAAVCVCGGIQPTILQRALTIEYRENGILARLLLAYPPRRTKRWTEADIDPIAETKLARLFDRFYELQLTQDGEPNNPPTVIHLSPDAKAAWTTYYNEHAVEQADLVGDLAAAWSKLEEYAARLALLIHFVRWAARDPTLGDTENVDVASMTAAIRLTQWFKREAQRVYATLDETETDRHQRRLAEWIDRKGGSVTAREVQHGCRWLKEPGMAEAALEELVKAGRGTWRDAPTTAKGGRPGRVFLLSTPSTVHETPARPEETEGFVDVDSVDAPATQPLTSNGQANFFTPAGPYADGF
jgi:hypothetical protein